MKKVNNFTTGAIYIPLIGFTLPVLLAMLLQSMYGAADLLIVGKFADTADISGVSTGSLVTVCITSLITGISMGITVLLGRTIGEGELDRCSKVIGSGICVCAVLAAALTVLGVIFTDALVKIMHAPPQAYKATFSYVRICTYGYIFITAYNVLGSIFRGMGDSKMPLLTVAISCAVNVLGDLLLVAGFKLGAAGAAAATVASQGISVFLSVLIIKKRGLPFRFSLSDIRIEKNCAKSILKTGTPIGMQDIMVGISFLVITAIINSLGLVRSAGVGVAERICAFVMLIPSSFSQSLSAFVAQNAGAEEHKRASAALRYAIATSLCVGFVIGYISFFHGDMLASVFANDKAVISEAADYLRAYAIDCLLTAFLFCLTGYFTGYGKTTFVMLQGILSAFLIRIPVSYFISRIPGASLFLIGLATPCSTLIQITAAGIYFAVMKRPYSNTQTDL